MADFASFFMGGFECSSHRRRDRRRLDLLASTRHDVNADADYAALATLGMKVARDGVRWHLVEHFPGHYDWSSLRPMAEAAARRKIQVIWDLCHYGWPDHLDIWSEAFVERFAAFAAAAARVLREAGNHPPIFCPVNEISYWAWAGGEAGLFNPCTEGRGAELKRQLARAAIAATRAIREVEPAARFVTAEPLIRVAGEGARAEAAARFHASQFEAIDMLLGDAAADIGGASDLVDWVGLNFYPANQWDIDAGTIGLGDHRYVPLRDLLAAAHHRHRKPLFVAETGAESTARAAWLHYVASEVAAAREAGVPVGGICLYPVLDYHGWDNGRACPVGLWGPPGADGIRPLDVPLANELRRQQDLLRP